MIGREVRKYIDKEKEAIGLLTEMEMKDIEDAIELIEQCQGNIVFAGVGKSGHIGAKLAATYSSLGIPSFFVHATESLHGDLGMIKKEDVVILLSNSGNTDETINMLNCLNQLNIKTIGFCSNAESELAKKSTKKIIYPRVVEADSNGLAPTSSTTITLVLGDAIACAISEKRDFGKNDFHKFHPGGNLGKQLQQNRE